MSSSPNVLSERDPNVTLSPEKVKAKGENKQQDGPKSLDYHRQVLESRLKESQSVTNTNKNTMSQPSAASFGSSNYNHSHQNHHAHTIRSLSRNQQTYVSPSDNIMSPATAKLAAFKNRHVKGVKPRMLFAKATSNAEAAAAKQPTTSSTTEQDKSRNS